MFTNQTGGQLTLILYILAFIGIYYFLIIAPQRRRIAAHKALMERLKPSDRVVTASGIYGTVKDIKDDIVMVEIAKDAVVQMSKEAIVGMITETGQVIETEQETE